MIGLTKKRNRLWKWVSFASLVPTLIGVRLYYKHSIPAEQEIYCWIGVVVGIFFFFNGFQRERLRRRALSVATSRIRSMALGIVEVRGQAQSTNQKLRDPIFQMPCVYFSIRVEEERGSGKNRHWVTIYDKNTDTVPFYIKDQTGRVMFNPYGAENEAGELIVERLSYTLFAGSSVDSAAKSFMVSVGGAGGSKKLRARIIREDYPVYILGFAQTLPHQFREDHVSIEEAGRELKRGRINGRAPSFVCLGGKLS